MTTPHPLMVRLAPLAAALTLVATPLTTMAASAQEMETSLVDATLVADVHSIAPGVPFHLGVRFDMAESWHINWINPGDAGLAPSVDWQLPAGFKAQLMGWPHPHRYPAGPLVIFGYEHTVTLWTTVTPPATLPAGQNIELRAAVDWLACRESCVPGEEKIGLTLPVETSARVDTALVRSHQESQRRVPVAAATWSLTARYSDDEIVLAIDAVAPLEGPAPAGVFFYPDVPGIIENSEPQRLEIGARGLSLGVTRSRMGPALPKRLTGVLVSQTGWGPDVPTALRVDVRLEPR